MLGISFNVWLQQIAMSNKLIVRNTMSDKLIVRNILSKFVVLKVLTLQVAYVDW
jgi:hypothetical protein